MTILRHFPQTALGVIWMLAWLALPGCISPWPPAAAPSLEPPTELVVAAPMPPAPPPFASPAPPAPPPFAPPPRPSPSPPAPAMDTSEPPPRRSCGACGCTTYEESVADFVARAKDHLRRFFPNFAAPKSDRALDAFVREGIRRAEKHGIVNERDVVKYIDVWATRGDGFEAEPWAARILADRTRSPTQRADDLFDATFPDP